jgi:type IV pilus assembly protein PilV
MMRSGLGRRRQRGFTLMEVMVSLVITIIGLAGVLRMQSITAKSNRRSAQFTRAANIAEETMESIRGTKITELLAGVTYGSVTYNGVEYSITTTATEVADNTNLVLLTVSVTYDEDGDTSTSDDRRARVQMLRTKTETL